MSSEFDDRPDLIKKRVRAVRARWALIISVVFIVVVILLTLFFNAVSAISTRQALLDCTTPQGKCYEESQKRTAEVVQDLITAGRNGEIATRLIVVLAVGCANTLEETTVEAIQRCVDRQLEANK